MDVSMNWGAIGLGGVIIFFIGWWLLGPLGAIVTAIVVLLLMGTLKIR